MRRLYHDTTAGRLAEDDSPRSERRAPPVSLDKIGGNGSHGKAAS